MWILTEILASLAKFSIEVISFAGYPGIVFLMALESMIVPLPSELVMPFAGFLVSLKNMSFLGVVIASSIGSLIGSLISYYIGKYLGIGFVKNFGRYFLLDESDLKNAEKWFETGGEKTIFIGRFIPVVRHFISIPAGIAKMNLKKFCFYTLLGAGIWNTFLAWLGWLLGENWASIRQFLECISIGMVIALIIGLGWFGYKHILKKMNN